MSIDINSLIDMLSSKHLYYEMASHRDGYIMVTVRVPGEIWEIEFSKTGAIEIEIFRSDGTILDETALDDLFRRFANDLETHEG